MPRDWHISIAPARSYLPLESLTSLRSSLLWFHSPKRHWYKDGIFQLKRGSSLLCDTIGYSSESYLEYNHTSFSSWLFVKYPSDPNSKPSSVRSWLGEIRKKIRGIRTIMDYDLRPTRHSDASFTQSRNTFYSNENSDKLGKIRGLRIVIDRLEVLMLYWSFDMLFSDYDWRKLGSNARTPNRNQTYHHQTRFPQPLAILLPE